ncbi:hypothetical protein MANES_02G220810v8 [Manihot esculenta]|uniref:Uncharacterized protein n=1 Tax=Manihot esculenta TaxID=3983 RepID=A0ACB7I804_MANES|nr:hypothetical protein MANES_02G220810v8 [Manihot esculenta]
MLMVCCSLLFCICFVASRLLFCGGFTWFLAALYECMDFVVLILADLLGSPVVRPADIDTTALGAAYAAGLAVGIWKEEEIFASGEKAKTDTLEDLNKPAKIK